MALKLGILDQSIVFPGQTSKQALENTIKLAQVAEGLGYERFWVSEHHDSPQVVGSSPEVLISHLLARTERIRIGSGGVMLQHYSPYKVAENFNILALLAPDRVDLGIGRAPGGLPRSTKALQKGITQADALDDKLVELVQFVHGAVGEEHPLAGLQASPIPDVPAQIHLLGTSVSSAELAAKLGLPYVYALFINNDSEALQQTLEAYRNNFNRAGGAEPRIILALSVIATDTEEEAAELAGSLKSIRVTLASGKAVNVSSLEQAAEFARQAGETYETEEREIEIIKGTKETVRQRLLEFTERYGTEELIFTSVVPDFEKRVRSFTLIKEAFEEQTSLTVSE